MNAAAKDHLIVFTNHCFKRYAERILIFDSFKDKLEKRYGSQYWMEHLMLCDLLCSDLVTGKKEEEINKVFHRGGNINTIMTNYVKGWTYYNEMTGNVFFCSRENPYLAAITCCKYDFGKSVMSMCKWFYNKGSENIIYKNYFNQARSLMAENGIKTLNYRSNEIGYLNENNL